MVWRWLYLIYRPITHSTNILRYFESNHLTRGRYGPIWGNLHLNGYRALYEIALPRRKLLDTATCCPFFLGTFARVLRPKLVKPTIDGFETQTTKTPTSSVLHTLPPPSTHLTVVLDQPACQVFLSLAQFAHPPSWLSQHDYSHYTCACWCPSQPPWLVTRPPGPSVKASCSPFIALGPSVQHVST